MIIIRPVNNSVLPRCVAERLGNHLRVMPAVVVTGARQTGKSTLAQAFGERRYVTLDDFDALDVARRNPDAIIGGDQPVTIDEVQRAPDLLLAIQRAIDRNRRPGRFLITGSANLLLMRQISESLAGRASYLTIWPMTLREQAGQGVAGRWEEIVATPETEWDRMLADASAHPADWREVVTRGGYPTPALQLKSAEERAVWFDGYVRTYLERDLRELSEIASLTDFRRLMHAACLRLGGMINQSELGRDCALAQPTVHRWLNLMETSYLLVRLPAYAVHRTKRLIKSPKFYWSDTGLACHLAGTEAPGGALLENLVLHDLLVWRDSRREFAELFYWRTTIGEEVDFVVETGGKLLPIDVKADKRPRLADAKNLRAFRAEYGKKARAGLLLHAGNHLEWLAPDVLAVPWWRVLKENHRSRHAARGDQRGETGREKLFRRPHVGSIFTP